MFRSGAFAFEVVRLEIRVLDVSAWSSVLMRRHSPPPEKEFVFRARTAGRLGAATDGGAQKDHIFAFNLAFVLVTIVRRRGASQVEAYVL